jgi:cysteine synthase
MIISADSFLSFRSAADESQPSALRQLVSEGRTMTMIAGLGTSVPPPLLDTSYVDDVARVEEADPVRACHRLARHGLVFGGSTGMV